MRKFLKVSAILVGIFAVYLTVTWFDTYVYPFRADSPNFSDVEKSFDSIQFPSDWKEIKSSENRGIKGRGCDPYNSSGCFHKSKTFAVPQNVDINSVKIFLSSEGCPSPNTSSYKNSGDQRESFNFECGVGNGLQYTGNVSGRESVVSVTVSTL